MQHTTFILNKGKIKFMWMCHHSNIRRLMLTFKEPEKHDNLKGQLQRVGEITGFKYALNLYNAEISIFANLFIKLAQGKMKIIRCIYSSRYRTFYDNVSSRK